MDVDRHYFHFLHHPTPLNFFIPLKAVSCAHLVSVWSLSFTCLVLSCPSLIPCRLPVTPPPPEALRLVHNFFHLQYHFTLNLCFSTHLLLSSCLVFCSQVDIKTTRTTECSRSIFRDISLSSSLLIEVSRGTTPKPPVNILQEWGQAISE